MFLSLYLSEGCNRFLLGSMALFLSLSLRVYELLLLYSLTFCPLKFLSLVILLLGVTLVRCGYSLLMNLAALFCICSNFLIFSLAEGSHTADAYSSIGLTNLVGHFYNPVDMGTNS